MVSSLSEDIFSGTELHNLHLNEANNMLLNIFPRFQKVIGEKFLNKNLTHKFQNNFKEHLFHKERV